ncbi:MAG: NYN domain-containing protein [Anaerolineales bacterium]|nr:NYN domain-containing protein [Anaerolineales bacterium]MDP3185584.1 NYN domain-containing protein [Anaerolineales bacterium]
MLTNAFQDRFDTAFLVSADSDLVSPIKAVKRLFDKKKVVVAFPPARSSSALQRVAHAHYFIGRDKLSKSFFPEEVVKPDGFVLRRPAEWH